MVWESPNSVVLQAMLGFVVCSALFPLPISFVSTGVIANTFVMIVVAAGTLYTSELLLHQAHMTGQSDLETLCLVVGGKWWKVRDGIFRSASRTSSDIAFSPETLHYITCAVLLASFWTTSCTYCFGQLLRRRWVAGDTFSVFPWHMTLTCLSV